jgi:hypothetical protein
MLAPVLSFLRFFSAKLLQARVVQGADVGRSELPQSQGVLMMKRSLPRVSPALVAAILIAISIATLVEFGLGSQHGPDRIGLKVSGDFLPYWAVGTFNAPGAKPIRR